MSDEHLGIVRLSMPDGRTIPLRFTIGRMGQMGRDGIVTRMQTVIEGLPGDGQALAELLDLTSGGEIKAKDVLEGEQPPLDLAIFALNEAWALYRFGPARQPEGEGSANPLIRLWTRLKTLCRRVFARG
ncbi:hypothetical protein [Phenylobacterium sp.]|uniref:hypothetical protein n=1 Tax=Phenylobacterium sp. TaxID=1871053 RepID=UPI0030012573